MKITLTNVLQAVIIALLSILSWVIANQGKSINDIDKAVGETQVDIAVIKFKTIQNDTEHKEIKAMLKEHTNSKH